MTWQPIETAPKDGEGIIAWGPPFQRSGEMFWDNDIRRWVLPGLIPPPQNQPTHWRPLPEPPLSNPPEKGESE